MRLPQARSLRELIVIGTLLVVVPFVGVVVHATVQMRALSQRGAALIARTAAYTRAGEELSRSSIAIERAARLRLALGDPSLDGAFGENVQRANDAVTVLEADEDAETHRYAVGLRAGIASLASDYRAAAEDPKPTGAQRLKAAIDRYAELTPELNALDRHLTRQTTGQLDTLEALTEATERRLYRELAVLIPVTVVLVALFLWSLRRPLRRIDRAIDALGRGHYAAPIAVPGPADLARLGSQLEWLRQRLIEVAEAKSRFLRHMSHELKTPLASLREGTELLLEGAVGPLGAEQREVAGILRDNGIRLQRHIENLLSYSAWEAQTGALDLEEFPLRDLVRTVIESHRMTLLARHQRLTVNVDELTVTADRGKLRLILDNLLSNAVKYTPNAGSLEIRASADGAGLLLEVIDSGPGIAPEDRAHLFEAFYTGRPPESGPLRGTGIGLSVVSEFTEAHGGRIELVETEGQGAHFRLRLPAYPRATRRPTGQTCNA